MSEIIGEGEITFGGVDEPLSHPDIVKVVMEAKKLGLRVGLVTDGILMNSSMAKRLLPYLSWIEFNVNAGEVKTYAKLHKAQESNYKTVLDNISRCSFIIRLHKLECTINVKCLLLNENISTIPNLSRFLKYAKVNYLILEFNGQGESPSYDEIYKIYEESRKFETDTYQVILKGISLCFLNEIRKDV